MLLIGSSDSTARRLDCIEGNVPAAVGTPRGRAYLPVWLEGGCPLQCRCSTWSSAWTTPNTHPTAFDPAAFITQQIMAISGIVLLLLGSRITHFYHRYRLRDGERDRHPIWRGARNWPARWSCVNVPCTFASSATALIRLAELAEWLKAQGHHAVANSLLHTPNVHSRLFREQTSMVYPRAWSILGFTWPCRRVASVSRGS